MRRLCLSWVAAGRRLWEKSRGVGSTERLPRLQCEHPSLRQGEGRGAPSGPAKGTVQEPAGLRPSTWAARARHRPLVCSTNQQASTAGLRRTGKRQASTLAARESRTVTEPAPGKEERIGPPTRKACMPRPGLHFAGMNSLLTFTAPLRGRSYGHQPHFIDKESLSPQTPFSTSCRQRGAELGAVEATCPPESDPRWMGL